MYETYYNNLQPYSGEKTFAKSLYVHILFVLSSET